MLRGAQSIGCFPARLNVCCATTIVHKTPIVASVAQAVQRLIAQCATPLSMKIEFSSYIYINCLKSSTELNNCPQRFAFGGRYTPR